MRKLSQLHESKYWVPIDQLPVDESLSVDKKVINDLSGYNTDSLIKFCCFNFKTIYM
jgi:hypothetical protein